MGLLTEGGLSALAMLCALHGKLVQTWSAGEAPKVYLIAQYRSLAGDFSLTPVARAGEDAMQSRGAHRLQATATSHTEPDFARRYHHA